MGYHRSGHETSFLRERSKFQELSSLERFNTYISPELGERMPALSLEHLASQARELVDELSKLLNSILAAQLFILDILC